MDDFEKMIKIMQKNLANKSEFQEPLGWQARLMTRLKEREEPQSTIWQHLAAFNGFMLKLSCCSILLAFGLHFCSNTTGTDTDEIPSLISKNYIFGATSVDLIWSVQ